METENTVRPVHGGNLTWAAAVAGCSPNLLLDFSASISPLGPPLSVLEAIQTGIAALRHYPNPSYLELRQALSTVHNISADWILPGNGSAELLTWACRELAECDVTYLLTPAFGDYNRGLRAFEASVVSHPLLLNEPWLMGRQLTQELMERVGTSQKSNRAGLIINTPHNPSGCLLSRGDLLPLLEQFALIVVDEAFMDFLPPERQESWIDWVAHHPNLVVLRSLTKFYSLPGLRLGYAIGHPERLRRWQQWRDPWPVNGLAVEAAKAALQDVAFQQQTWNWLAIARPQLYEGLQVIPGLDPLPGAANYLLVRSDYPVPALQESLLKHHRVLIRDCLSFPELGDRYFRVAVRTVEENQQLIEGLIDITNGCTL